MLSSSAGIVVKNFYSSACKYVILDKQHGRLECIAQENIVIGSLLHYSLAYKRTLYVINDIQVLYVPLSLGSIDLLFFHHVLELIYYFAPLGSCVVGVFDLISFLYTAEDMVNNVKFKKFFLFKLLTILGVTPQWEVFKAEYISFFHSMEYLSFNDELLDTMREKELDKWLWMCISQHPYIKEFKTVHFLEMNRTV